MKSVQIETKNPEHTQVTIEISASKQFTKICFSDHESNITKLGCQTTFTLARRASPFLYPCVIEYSLIAAAIVYKIYQVIGT